MKLDRDANEKGIALEQANDEEHAVADRDEENQLPSRTRLHLLKKRLQSVHQRLGELIFVGMIGILVGITGIAAYKNVATKGWGADAAAWAQATGSIIAIAGAAWLARSESRQARRWRREQGEEAAWSVRFVLVQAQFDAHIIAFELTRPDEPYCALDIRSWQQRSANASLTLQTMLTRVDHIHAAVVLTMCNAKILVDHLSLDLARMERAIEQEKKPSSQLVSDIVAAHLNLTMLIEQYDARLRGIREALDRGRDMLPLGEFSGWASQPER
ncbi:hypothetical protein UB44_17675 [Burkholderiaceae bacterium 26]|nr:hypothetical protein UB44_17675 [Burkholderiaceae bacterium 26]